VAFESVRLYHFRNLADATIETNSRDIFLVGENGQGKTNFLEAIYFTCYGSSFRTRRDDTLIRHGESDLAVEAAIRQGDDTRRIVIKQTGRKKSIELNGKSISDRKEIVSNVPCIVFCHDDIGFVTGAPEMQRWFMNQTLSLIDRDYLDALRLYNRVLRSRNAALRSGQHMVLDALDQQLVEAGVPIVERRRDVNSRFSQVLTRLFSTVFEGDEELRLNYRASWRSEDPHDEMQNRRENDIRMATTTSGPHRDRFVYHFGPSILTDVASTGQLRLVSLILRVAQAQFVRDATGSLPVLLLDDVLLELDPRRRARFVEALPDYEQAFFTFLPDEQYARFRHDSTRTYRVEGGMLN
jgi:DNA replication and repair protein RecF